MSEVQKVGEVFSAAGTAFSRLAEITATMNIGEGTVSGSKWDEDDISMLHASVRKFSDDLDKLLERIKIKTNQQAKANVKKHVQATKGTPSMAGGDGIRY